MAFAKVKGKAKTAVQTHKIAVIVIVVICLITFVALTGYRCITAAHAEKAEWAVPISWTAKDSSATIQGTAVVKAKTNNKRKVSFTVSTQCDSSIKRIWLNVYNDVKGEGSLASCVTNEKGANTTAIWDPCDGVGSLVDVFMPPNTEKMWTGTYSFEASVDAEAFDRGSAMFSVAFLTSKTGSDRDKMGDCVVDLSLPETGNR